MAHVLRMLDTCDNKYTLRIYNTHCFSTATMVARRRLKVTLSLLCLFFSLFRNVQSGCGANPHYLVVTGDSYSQSGRRVKPNTHPHLLKSIMTGTIFSPLLVSSQHVLGLLYFLQTLDHLTIDMYMS
jgi:hypothetical protein